MLGLLSFISQSALDIVISLTRWKKKKKNKQTNKQTYNTVSIYSNLPISHKRCQFYRDIIPKKMKRNIRQEKQMEQDME